MRRVTDLVNSSFQSQECTDFPNVVRKTIANQNCTKYKQKQETFTCNAAS